MPFTASILIAAHNARAYVSGAIASALGQSCADIEVIVVDDGSTDGTFDIIAGYARQDPRVVPVRRPDCGGPAAARNEGLRRARGRWIAVLDADDLFLPGRLERMVALAEASGADMLADNLIEREFETGHDLGLCFAEEQMCLAGPVALAEMVRRDMPDLPGRCKFGFLKPIIRRDFLRAHDLAYREEIHASEDFLLYFECVAAGARLHLTPEAYYVYALRQGSISTRRASSVHLSRANRRMAGIAAGRGDAALAALLRRRQRRIDSDCFGHFLEGGQPAQALAYLRTAEPARMLRSLRVTLGAARRRLLARRPTPAVVAGPGPEPRRRQAIAWRC